MGIFYSNNICTWCSRYFSDKFPKFIPLRVSDKIILYNSCMACFDVYLWEIICRNCAKEITSENEKNQKKK